MKSVKYKTAVLITHRLGAVKMVDRILVLYREKLLNKEYTNNCLKQKGIIINCGNYKFNGIKANFAIFCAVKKLPQVYK
ncbi:hypothetical protein CLTEP_21480 [Clostridium tepidiprofundi DSM 19306]|uniref:Uncharacterized protein n=1 Tax=Clostridium tepidiprofundi DSM 19306 TaxID=1121338 RepID=A0A151B0E2_9CLOT|nr:hypothetical protein CLTEP_21480 [Clostridium tepidiprofundi DSM 19306]